MSYTVTQAVRQQAASVLAPAEVAAALKALAATPLPHLPRTTDEVERVHLAVLHLCGGTLEGLRTVLGEAKRDWRDVLMGAGLAFENWPEVLRSRGITPSLSPNPALERTSQGGGVWSRFRCWFAP